MLTNICLGTTIFTFAVRAKQFGLIWLIIATIFCGAVNYWTILRAVMASKPMKEHDYSEITEKLLGRKARLILNFLIILYSYALVCVLLHLCFLYLVDLFNILVIELNIKHMMNLLKLFGINLMLNFIVYYYSIFTKFSLFN
jgi:amino acid permease